MKNSHRVQYDDHFDRSAIDEADQFSFDGLAGEVAVRAEANDGKFHSFDQVFQDALDTNSFVEFQSELYGSDDGFALFSHILFFSAISSENCC